MKFADFAVLAVQSNRLQAAAHAIRTCESSLKEPEQMFGFANQTFTGNDAIVIKTSLLHGLSLIADDARDALLAGGIEFDDVPAETIAVSEDLALLAEEDAEPAAPEAKEAA